ARQIYEELAEDRTRALIERLRKAGLRMELDESERRKEGGPLDGKTLVLTGTLPPPRREQATKLIRRAGGKVVNSVSKKTDYVIAGDSPGAKLAKATELRTDVLDEDGLRELIGEDGSPEGSTPPRGGVWRARLARQTPGRDCSLTWPGGPERQGRRPRLGGRSGGGCTE